VPTLDDYGEGVEMLGDLAGYREASAVLCGGDVDADWQRAAASGEEAVGGTVATPDQDVVDEIGHALGVEQAPDAPVITSAEILHARDRHYWHLERRAAAADDR
jgi:hypothetical protein